MRSSPAILSVFLLAACSAGPPARPAEQPAAAQTAAAQTGAAAPATPLAGSVPGAVTLPEHGSAAVGAPLQKGELQSLAAILASPEAYAGKTVLVEGKVRAACTRKGCWMELAPLKEAGAACRIKFKDYAFFVPTSSVGADARLSGEVKVRTLAPEEVAHLEGEGAHLTKAADGSAQAVEITATGVELTRL